MPTAAEIKPGKYLRALVFGSAGSGKTEFAATFPRPAFCDCDNGMLTLANPGFRARYPDIDLNTIHYETFSDDVNATGMFAKATGLREALDWMNEMIENDDIETIVLDSLTSFSDLAMHVGLELNANVGDKGKSQSLANAKRTGFITLTQADFGAEMSVIAQVFDKLTSSRVKKHVVVIAHERTDKTKDGAIIRREPLITGDRLRAAIGRWFDEVWYLDVEGTGSSAERVLKTASDGTRKVLKSRLGLPETINEPSYFKIQALLSMNP